MSLQHSLLSGHRSGDWATTSARKRPLTAFNWLTFCKQLLFFYSTFFHSSSMIVCTSDQSHQIVEVFYIHWQYMVSHSEPTTFFLVGHARATEGRVGFHNSLRRRNIVVVVLRCYPTTRQSGYLGLFLCLWVYDTYEASLNHKSLNLLPQLHMWMSRSLKQTF